MQVFLSVAPRDVRAALQYHNRLAHVAYRIGEDSRLLRQNLLQCRGGLLSLSDCRCPPIQRPEALCRELVRECLTPREGEIIRLRYGLGGTVPLTQREVASSFGISRSYVSRIEKRALEKLRAGLEGPQGQ